jgi:hypothetical protein
VSLTDARIRTFNQRLSSVIVSLKRLSDTRENHVVHGLVEMTGPSDGRSAQFAGGCVVKGQNADRARMMFIRTSDRSLVR